MFIIAREIALRLEEITRRDVLTGEYGHVKEGFAFAEKWLREGTVYEKMAITNLFLFSIAHTIDCLGSQRRKLQDMLPPLLKKEYLAQIYNAGT